MKINYGTIIDKIFLFFKRASYCFTFLVASMAFIGRYLKINEEFYKMSVEQILSFLVYSLLFATSFFIADFIKDNAIIKNAVRFLLTYSSLISIIMLGGTFESFRRFSASENPDFTYIVILSMIFVGVYVAASLLIILRNFIVSKLTDSNKEYTSIFSENDK